MSDMSSPNHALDSPVSDDYSTVSAGVLDTNSISGIAGGDVLTSNFKSNYQIQLILKIHKKEIIVYQLIINWKKRSNRSIESLFDFSSNEY
jgi:hypothetical protein